jgi:hypothetical protein
MATAKTAPSNPARPARKRVALPLPAPRATKVERHTRDAPKPGDPNDTRPRPSESRKARLRLPRLPPIDAEKYPNLANLHALDRALHIHRAMEMGLSRKEAIRHAEEHLSPKRS